MKKRVLSLLMATLLCLFLLPLEVRADEGEPASEPVEAVEPDTEEGAEEEENADEASEEASSDAEDSSEQPRDGTVTGSGSCGNNLTWTLDEEGTLTISGTGDMWDFEYGIEYDRWYHYRSYFKNVVIEDGVTSISKEAFENCGNLTSISIADSVTYIGQEAFRGCSGFETFTIPVGVTSIHETAFNDCYGLKEFLVADGNTSYTSQFGILYDSAMSCLVACPIARGGTDCAIPSTVTSIGAYAFYDCSSIKKILMQANVYNIGDHAFDGCTSLESITIQPSVTRIGKWTFYGCKSLTSIELPENVTSIGKEAFGMCDGLTSITIPKNVKKIEDYAFSECSNLDTIVFEGDAPEIVNFAFFRVTATAYYPANNKTWTDSVRKDYEGDITWVEYQSDVPEVNEKNPSETENGAPAADGSDTAVPSGKEVNSGNIKSPQTSDNTDAFIWSALLILSAAGFAAVLIKKQRR